MKLKAFCWSFYIKKKFFAKACILYETMKIELKLTRLYLSLFSAQLIHLIQIHNTTFYITCLWRAIRIYLKKIVFQIFHFS